MKTWRQPPRTSRRMLKDRTEAAAAERTAATEAADVTVRERTAALDVAGFEPDADLAAILTQAEIRAAETTERVGRIERTLEAGADLGERMEAARTDLALAQRLRDDLQPSRSLAWLLGEDAPRSPNSAERASRGADRRRLPLHRR